jgi:hypothetical protein
MSVSFLYFLLLFFLYFGVRKYSTGFSNHIFVDSFENILIIFLINDSSKIGSSFSSKIIGIGTPQ